MGARAERGIRIKLDNGNQPETGQSCGTPRFLDGIDTGSFDLLGSRPSKPWANTFDVPMTWI